METCKECNREFETLESVFRHQRSHGQTAQAYVLKWDHGGARPLCTCGCGQKTAWNVGMKKYASFVKGHSSKGRTKSEDEKRRIGEKNRANMKRWMARHPDIAAKRATQLLEGRTEDVEVRRIAATKRTYADMSSEDKRKFSDHVKELWKDGTLAEAHVKATETFKQRSASGEYDFTERNDRISQAITQKYLDGGFAWATGSHESTKTGRSHTYRSSWELQFMLLLDADDRVESWASESFSIPYLLDGIRRRYVPDFHVVTREGRDLLVEVKPPELRDAQMNVEKREAAIEFCVRNDWIYAEWHPDALAPWEDAV